MLEREIQEGQIQGQALATARALEDQTKQGVLFYHTKDGESWKGPSLEYRGARNACLVIGISQSGKEPIRVAHCSLACTTMGGRGQHTLLAGRAAPHEGYLPVKAARKSIPGEGPNGKARGVLEVIDWTEEERRKLVLAGHLDPNDLLTPPRLEMLKGALEVSEVVFTYGHEDGEASIARGYSNFTFPQGVPGLSFRAAFRLGD